MNQPIKIQCQSPMFLSQRIRNVPNVPSLPDKNHSIQILINFRIHYFSAGSLILAEEWVKVLQNVIQRSAVRQNLAVPVICQVVFQLLDSFQLSAVRKCSTDSCWQCTTVSCQVVCSCQFLGSFQLLALRQFPAVSCQVVSSFQLLGSFQLLAVRQYTVVR